MADYELHLSGNLLAVRFKRDHMERLTNGLLKYPPAVYVLHYSLVHDRVEASPIDWDAAKAVAPTDMESIADWLDKQRDAEPWKFTSKDVIAAMPESVKTALGV